MTAQDKTQRTPPYTGFLLLSAAAEATLNVPPLAFYMPWRPSWHLIAVPALLAGGFIGSVLRSRFLRFAGWVGICLGVCAFVLGSLAEVEVDLNYSFGEGIYPPSDSLNHLALTDILGLPVFGLIIAMDVLTGVLALLVLKPLRRSRGLWTQHATVPAT